MTPQLPNMIMYTDETNSFFQSRSKEVSEDMANAYLVTLSEWLGINRLRLTVNKTKYIIFRIINSCGKKLLAMRFGDNILEQVEEQKRLGVWFHEKMSWMSMSIN